MGRKYQARMWSQHIIILWLTLLAVRIPIILEMSDPIIMMMIIIMMKQSHDLAHHHHNGNKNMEAGGVVRLKRVPVKYATPYARIVPVINCHHLL